MNILCCFLRKYRFFFNIPLANNLSYFFKFFWLFSLFYFYHSPNFLKPKMIGFRKTYSTFTAITFLICSPLNRIFTTQITAPFLFSLVIGITTIKSHAFWLKFREPKTNLIIMMFIHKMQNKHKTKTYFSFVHPFQQNLFWYRRCWKIVTAHVYHS